MKTLFFAVNGKHNLFFEKIKQNTACKGDIVYARKIKLPCFKALKYIHQVDLSKAIDLKTKDFKAKIGFVRFEFFIKAMYTFLAYFNYILYFGKINDSYDQIMLWNGITFRQAIALEISKLYNLKIIVVENGLMPNRIVVDIRGVNYLNSVPRDRAFFDNYENMQELPNTLIPRNPKNAKKFAHTKQIELPEKYIFVPFQVDYDTQILVHSPWINDMNKLFDVIEEVANQTDIAFVFKEHPSSKKDYPHLHKRAEKNSQLFFANGHTTQELIEKSEAVITINSTVGIESLLFDKKVIVLGDAFYTIDGITKWAKDISELTEIVLGLEKWELDKPLIKKFLKYLYYDYMLEGNFVDENKNQMKRIEAILGCHS